jgi:mono/diheme cytochrome c family protein
MSYMKKGSLLVLATAVFSAVLFQSITRAQTATSVLNGVYTADQAKRGQALYTENCSACHGEKLDGNEGSFPVLSGPAFVANWPSVGHVFDKVKESMPATAPGSLKAAEVSDILAYILSVNKFPEGQAELGSDIDPLFNIKLESR